ncbi:hypothetical protein BDY24DRAFT_261240 [Mrakia frigida]|uniref:uncharacterized protein n=1 Tax=Mrakia frigida TaxID=29902 RepID=UPI003FCBF151
MILLVPSSAHDRSLRVPFYSLYWVSLLSSLFILAVFCFGRLQRHFTIKYLFVALATNAIFNIIPIRSSPNPSMALCVVVASGTLAGTVMTAAAAASLVFRTWSLVVLSVRISPRVASAINAFCLIVPTLAWIGVFTGIALSTSLRPNNLSVFAFAITPRSKLDNRAPRVVSLTFLAFVLVFEIWTLIYLLRRTKVVTAHTIPGDSPSFVVDDEEPTHRPSTFDRAFNVRVLIFGGWLAASIGMIVLVLVKGRGNVPALFQSTGGICASLVFGSQRDVLEYLHLCPKHKSTTAPPSSLFSRATRSGPSTTNDLGHSTRRTRTTGSEITWNEDEDEEENLGSEDLRLDAVRVVVARGERKEEGGEEKGSPSRGGSRREGEDGGGKKEGEMSLKQMLESG